MLCTCKCCVSVIVSEMPTRGVGVGVGVDCVGGHSGSVFVSLIMRCSLSCFVCCCF